MRKLIGLAAVLTFVSPTVAQSLHATLYKNPNCPCCEGHAQYLREHGIEVDVRPVENIEEISKNAGIPAELEGCHTIMLDGYVIEGHASINAIQKLLTERPKDVVGISLPGMPLGTPGMTGEKTEPFTIYAVMKDGTSKVFLVE